MLWNLLIINKILNTDENNWYVILLKFCIKVLTIGIKSWDLFTSLFRRFKIISKIGKKRARKLKKKKDVIFALKKKDFVERTHWIISPLLWS